MRQKIKDSAKLINKKCVLSTFHNTFVKEYIFLGSISFESKLFLFTEKIHTVWSVNEGTARNPLKSQTRRLSVKIDQMNGISSP